MRILSEPESHVTFTVHESGIEEVRAYGPGYLNYKPCRQMDLVPYPGWEWVNDGDGWFHHRPKPLKDNVD